MAPSITKLSWYLSRHRKTDEEVILPWNGLTCLAVVCYANKFCSDSQNDALSDTIRLLNDLASKYQEALPKRYEGTSKTPEAHQKELEICQVFVDSFVPMMQKLFEVPKLARTSELLADFIHFLLQVINSEADCGWHEMQYFAPLQKGLIFLLTILGDTPFQCTKVEEVKNILAEFEDVINNVGTFVYSCIFGTCPISHTWFLVVMCFLLCRIEFLNAKIKTHCLEFCELPRCVIPQNGATVDSPVVIGSLLEDLENFLNGGDELTDDMKDQTRKLQKQLMAAQSFLKNMNPRQDAEIDELKQCIAQVRDVACEAEYLINSFVVGNIPVWYLTLRLHAVIKKFVILGTEFAESKKIYGRILSNVAKDFREEVSLQTKQTNMAAVDDGVVGLTDEKIRILSDLLGGSENLQIVYILGMPGIGKTTLAKQVYTDRSINDYFDENAWCVVSQTYSRRKVLIDILLSSASRPDKDIILKMPDESLSLEVHKTLKGRRYLIVMDDIWDSNVWYDLRRYFPDDENGSRIMFTSRIRSTAPAGSIIHKLSLMPEDQCWKLLEKKVFHGEHCPPRLMGIGKRIASKCNGLPLAVVVVAGILANMKRKESVWGKVEGSLDSYTSDCMKILELSYKHLPDHLKLCFLYLGAFPEDTEIPFRNLIRLWIAEGFIAKEEEMSPEQKAEEYLMDLTNRSLVMIVKTRSTGGVKSCTIHDLLREMCLRRADQEKILKLIKDDDFSTGEKHRCLCVHSTSLDFVRPFGHYCRSFSGHLSDPSSCFPQMKLVRVMNLSTNFDVDFFYKLRRIDQLVYLRYLVVDRMPEPILGNLHNLEFLRVDGLRHSVYVPSAVLKLVKLKHLHVKLRAKFGDDCNDFHTNYLETFSTVCIFKPTDLENLKCSPHLRKLNCMCLPILPDLRFLTRLESLKLFVRDIFNEFEVFKILKIFAEIHFPSTIRKLSMYQTLLPWEKMSIIGELPSLQSLKLNHDAFVGTKWETRDDEFQELMFLRLDGLELEQWFASSEHFPKLQRLELRKCGKLQKIPAELGDITALRMIEVHDSSYEACMSALQIEEEQREYGNEELKVIVTNQSWSKEQLMKEFNGAKLD